ncbi:MAG: plasmid mobilization protein [Segetibacter sp.]
MVGGRPKQAIKKDTVTGVRFSKLEYFVVKQKASRAGLGITVYIRQMAIHGQVVALMSEEEKHFVRELAGMSNNINQLTKKAHQEGLLKALLFLRATEINLINCSNRL